MARWDMGSPTRRWPPFSQGTSKPANLRKIWSESRVAGLTGTGGTTWRIQHGPMTFSSVQITLSMVQFQVPMIDNAKENINTAFAQMKPPRTRSKRSKIRFQIVFFKSENPLAGRSIPPANGIYANKAQGKKNGLRRANQRAAFDS